jgi:hypothetical protein
MKEMNPQKKLNLAFKILSKNSSVVDMGDSRLKTVGV